jgi:hypothetical protein
MHGVLSDRASRMRRPAGSVSRRCRVRRLPARQCRRRTPYKQLQDPLPHRTSPARRLQGAGDPGHGGSFRSTMARAARRRRSTRCRAVPVASARSRRRTVLTRTSDRDFLSPSIRRHVRSAGRASISPVSCSPTFSFQSITTRSPRDPTMNRVRPTTKPGIPRRSISPSRCTGT